MTKVKLIREKNKKGSTLFYKVIVNRQSSACEQRRFINKKSAMEYIETLKRG